MPCFAPALLLALTAGPAHAADTPPADPTLATESTTEVAPQKTRNYLMEVNFRGRYLFLPDSLLDIWYETHAGEANLERPHVAAYSLGLEFVVRNKQANGIFYAEYLSSLIKPGYWDDRDNPPDYLDGSYIQPEFFGLVMIGADYAYELHATNWLSFMFGAGIGVAIKTGNLIEWEPGEPEGTPNADNADQSCGPDSPAYERALTLDCANDGPVRVPPVLPVLDVNLGIRFNINDHASIRLDGGLHDLPYGGAAVGITF